MSLYLLETLLAVFARLVINDFMVHLAQENQVLVGIELAVVQQSPAWSTRRPCDDMGLVTHNGRRVACRFLGNE